MSNKPRYERLKKKWKEQASEWTFEHLCEVYEGAWIEKERMIFDVRSSEREIEKQQAYVRVLYGTLCERSMAEIGSQLEEPK